MSTYVISDIHGCFLEFQKMLEQIDFQFGYDNLIMAGDYIDRGDYSYDVVNWIIKNKSPKIIALRGNHEEEFIKNISLLNSIDINNNELLDVCNRLHESYYYFDLYGTIRELVSQYSFTITDLNKWCDVFKSMRYYHRLKVKGNLYTIVHAGYIDGVSYEEQKEFFLYARDNAYKDGGVRGRCIISGHTPTIVKDQFCYNNGDVFKYEADDNRRFYNIDCGCVFRKKNKNAKLATIRLDDEKIFYV